LEIGRGQIDSRGAIPRVSSREIETRFAARVMRLVAFVAFRLPFRAFARLSLALVIQIYRSIACLGLNLGE